MVFGVLATLNSLVDAASVVCILSPRGQQRGDQHLKRIFSLALGDLLDGRQLEPIDGARERAHDGFDARAC